MHNSRIWLTLSAKASDPLELIRVKVLLIVVAAHVHLLVVGHDACFVLRW
jgi:hypothetical protein